jgi:hypothetical protein
MAIVDTSTRKTALPAIMAERLHEIRRRDASLRLVKGLLDALALFLAALFVALVLDWTLTLFSTSARAALTYVALGAGGVGLLLLAIVPRFKRRTLTELATEVDRSVPGLEERWETVTQLNATSEPETISGSRVLFGRVIAETIERIPQVDPESVIPARRLRKRQWFLAAAIAANLALFLIDPTQTWVLLRRFCSPTASVSLTQVTAVSGDLAVARGEPVRLEATLAGRPRDSANLFLCNSQGEVTSVSLIPSAADGTRFVHAIDAADEPFSYRFRAGDGQTVWHEVAIYDRPRLTNVALRLAPPDYTHLAVVTKSELPTSLRAVEGSQLEASFSVDQPLDRFDLQLGTDSIRRLSAKENDPLRYVFKTKLDKTLRVTPVFVNQHGLSNLRPPTCQIIVYPDRPPVVAIISPEREISLRPNDEVTIEFAARDDFGVVRAELVAFVGDQPDLQHALVLPPQTQIDKPDSKTVPAPNAATAETTVGAARVGSEQKGTDAKSGGPAKKDASPSPPADKSTPAVDKKAEAANGAKDSPQTVVMPIPLGGQTGDKNVRAKIKLDLQSFHLKQGQQLQYMVRVYDSRSARSNGQSYGDAPNSADTMASGQDSKGRATDASRLPARPESPKKSTNKSPSAGVAKAPQSEKPASRQDNHIAEAAGRKTSALDNPASSTANQPVSEASSSQSRRASDKKETARSEAPQGQMAGAPRPQDTMTRRQLDVDSQSTVSSTMKIHIDKWAGSFDGQQRGKLELLIDPVLKELDAALAKAIEELRPVSDALAEGNKSSDDFKKSLRAADTQIARGQSLVADLVQKSDGTPYAFIGLQLVDITELHISPARLDVKAAKNDTPDRKDRVQQAEVHLTRAREMLADLTRKYEIVKRDLRLADEMQRIKTMYQVFIEDAMAFLASNRPTLNPKDRKMAQLELDEEFLKQYRELQQEWEKTLAELAKALSKDPRLLARYMSLSRRRADSLRDQLTILNNRQQELLVPVQQLLGDEAVTAPQGTPQGRNSAQGNDSEAAKPSLPPKQLMAAGTRTVRDTLSRDLAEIAAGTISVQEGLGTWLPQKMNEDPRLLPLRDQAAKISSLATLAVPAAGNPNGARAAAGAQQVDSLADQLKSFEAALAKFAESDDQQLALPVNRRLARVRKLEQLTTAWIEKNSHVTARRFHRALEMDQHRLSEETLQFIGKLESAGAQLAGLPDDVLTLADEIKDGIRYDVLVEQMSAELSLRASDLAAAKAHHKKAIEGFARAEERFNKLIDRVIAEQDKVPPQVPDLDNVQVPTLEELLARLESETDLAELLGIPDRPVNLDPLRDWLPGNQGGSGRGMMDGARAHARLIEQARRDALRAAREAAKTGSRSRPMATAARWNTLGSRLEDAVRQGRGNTPPRQYRQAIEHYFELISGAKNSSESAAPASHAKENGQQNALTPTGNSNNNR